MLNAIPLKAVKRSNQTDCKGNNANNDNNKVVGNVFHKGQLWNSSSTKDNYGIVALLDFAENNSLQQRK